MQHRNVRYTVKRSRTSDSYIAEVYVPDGPLVRREFSMKDRTQAAARYMAAQWCRDRIDDYIAAARRLQEQGGR